jgi:ATP-dependent RNA helicase DeaD
MNKIKFDELNLSKELKKAIDDLGYEEATPIQSQAIPVMLDGADIIGQAQTGTGKTAAFGIPVIEAIDISTNTLQALILCPTRELAIQVAEELSKIAKYKKEITFLPVYGGQPIERQISAMRKGVHIVIGTPGRIIDHLDRGTLKLDKVKMVVLDEADEMLDIGFKDDIETILKTTPKKRQTVLFSATMPKEITELAKKYQRSPVNIKVIHEVLTVPNTEQVYYELRDKDKLEVLSRVIDIYNLKLSLVFRNTKKGVDELVDQLQVRGYSAEGLHGDMRQGAREKVVEKFRKAKVEILVATDVAARGLDIENIEAVFNYDMPQDEDYYVHRIGRTGRAGKPGRAFSFVTGREIFRLRLFQKYIKTKIKLNPVPSYEDVEEMRINTFLEEIRARVREKGLEKYVNMAERLINEDYTSLDVSATLMKMILEKETNSSKISNEGGSVIKKGDDEVRLFINVGKKDKARPGDILGALTGETGISGDVVGNIDMYDRFSFINIPEGYAEKVIELMTGTKIKGRKVNIELANKK